MVHLPLKIYKQIIALLLVAGIYACFRYVVFDEVYWAHIPLYVFNKVVAFSAVFALLLSAVGFFKNNRAQARDWGVASFHLALYHIALSLIMLGPGYYSRFFWKGQMTFIAELVMFFGVFSVYCYAMLYFSKPGTVRMRAFKLLASGSIALHVAIYEYPGWFKPWQWSGHMPPISLWSFVFVMSVLTMFLMKDDARAVQDETLASP